MRQYPTLDEIEAQYFRDHPEEMDAYLSEIFDEYALDGNSAVLLTSLRVLARVKGVSTLADEIGMSRQGLQIDLTASPPQLTM